MLIYVVPLLVAVLIIAVVLAICCKVKAWIMKPVPLPRPLVTFFLDSSFNLFLWLGSAKPLYLRLFQIPDFGKQSQSYHHVSQTDVSMSRMIVMPSVSLEEEEEVVMKLREPEPVHQGSGSSGSGGQDEYFVRSRPCSDYLGSGSDQMDTRSTSVCSDSGEEPSYDRPHVCERVDLGDGEFVDGYRE